MKLFSLCWKYRVAVNTFPLINSCNDSSTSSSRNCFNNFQSPPFFLALTIVTQFSSSSLTISYLVSYPLSRSMAAKFSSQRMSAQLNVKNSWNGPRLSSLASISYFAFFQYLGVFFMSSRTLCASSNSYVLPPSILVTCLPLVPAKLMFLLICFFSMYATAAYMYAALFANLFSLLHIL